MSVNKVGNEAPFFLVIVVFDTKSRQKRFDLLADHLLSLNEAIFSVKTKLDSFFFNQYFLNA